MIGDASSKSVRYTIITCVMGITAATATMNAIYGYKLGSDKFEGIMFAISSVLIDGIKVLGLSFIAMALAKGYKAKGFFGLLVWLTCLGYSLNAATGFGMNARSTKNAEQQAEINTAIQSRENTKLIQEKYKRLVEEVETNKKNKIYRRSAGCTIPKTKMVKETLEFCDMYWLKNVEILEAAKAIEKAQSVEVKTAMVDPDPQMTFLAKKFGVTTADMIMIFAVMFAVLLEMISAFGQYAFSYSRATANIVRNKDGSVRKKRGRKPGSKNTPKPKLVVAN